MRALADSSGQYVIDSLLPNRYAVRAAFIGYCGTRDSVSLGPGQTARTDFVLRAPPCNPDTVSAFGAAARAHPRCRTDREDVVRWAVVEAVRGIQDLPPERFGVTRAPRRGTLVRDERVCGGVLAAYSAAESDPERRLERAYVVRLDTGTLAMLMPQEAGWVYFDRQYRWRHASVYLD